MYKLVHTENKFLYPLYLIAALNGQGALFWFRRCCLIEGSSEVRLTLHYSVNSLRSGKRSIIQLMRKVSKRLWSVVRRDRSSWIALSDLVCLVPPT